MHAQTRARLVALAGPLLPLAPAPGMLDQPEAFAATLGTFLAAR